MSKDTKINLPTVVNVLDKAVQNKAPIGGAASIASAFAKMLTSDFPEPVALTPINTTPQSLNPPKPDDEPRL